MLISVLIENVEQETSSLITHNSKFLSY